MEQLCGQLSVFVAEAHRLRLQSARYIMADYEERKLEEILRKERELRTEIFKQSGLPSYQLCEYCEPQVSSR